MVQRRCVLRWRFFCNRFLLSTLRFCSLRRRGVRGGEHDFQHGREQSYLPAVRGCSGCEEQPGTADLRAVPSAALQEGLPRLLPADHSASLPPPDQVRVNPLLVLCCNTVTACSQCSFVTSLPVELRKIMENHRNIK